MPIEVKLNDEGMYCAFRDTLFGNLHHKQVEICSPTLQGIKDEFKKVEQAFHEMQVLEKQFRTTKDPSLISRISHLVNYLDPYASDPVNAQLIREEARQKNSVNFWPSFAPTIVSLVLDYLASNQWDIANPIQAPGERSLRYQNNTNIRKFTENFLQVKNNNQFYVFKNSVRQDIPQSILYKNFTYFLLILQLMFFIYHYINNTNEIINNSEITLSKADAPLLSKLNDDVFSNLLFGAFNYVVMGVKLIDITGKVENLVESSKKQQIKKLLNLSKNLERKFISIANINNPTFLSRYKIDIPDSVKDNFQKQAVQLARKLPYSKAYLCHVMTEKGDKRWMVVYAESRFSSKQWLNAEKSEEMLDSRKKQRGFSSSSGKVEVVEEKSGTTFVEKDGKEEEIEPQTTKIKIKTQGKAGKPKDKYSKQRSEGQRDAAPTLAPVNYVAHEQPLKWLRKLNVEDIPSTERDAYKREIWQKVTAAARNLNTGTVDPRINLRLLKGTKHAIWEVRFVREGYRFYLFEHNQMTYILRAGDKVSQDKTDIGMADVAASYLSEQR